MRAIRHRASGRASIRNADRDRRLFPSRMGSPSGSVAFALSLAFATAVAAGCTSAAANPGSMPQPLIASETVGYFFPASVAQSFRGVMLRQITATLQRAAFRTCITHLGVGHQGEEYLVSSSPFDPLPMVPGWVMALGASYGLLDLRAISQNGMLVPILTAGDRGSASAGLSANEVRALSADGARCQQQVAQGVVQLYTQLNQRGRALENIWYAMIDRMLASGSVQNERGRFSSCLIGKGAPEIAAGSITQFEGWLMNVVNPGYVTGGSRRAFLPIAPRAAVDAHWSAVFVGCAVPLVTLLQRLLPRMQTAFLQAHYQEITALEDLVGRNLSDMERMSELG